MFISDQWRNLFYGNNINVIPENSKVLAEHVESRQRERDSYGDYVEGEGEIWVVFKVGDKYYKKYGYQDSYDDAQWWDGKIVEVKPTTKTVTVWE